jgi:hypothetical protein
MSYVMDFASKHPYDSRLEGITVDVCLTAGREHYVSFAAKVDTGAAQCFFRREYADVLGLAADRGQRVTFSTVNSTFEAFGHELTIRVMDIEFDAVIYFFADYSINRDVLGRRGWLDRVRLGLVDYESTLYLSAHNEA